MTFNVEVLLKGHEDVVTEVIQRDGAEPSAWTDDDVRDVLTQVLLSFDRVRHPDAEERSVSLRGLSWIVTPLERGVAIAIEIPSGAVVAGPFDVDADRLTESVARAIARPATPAGRVH